LGDDVSCGLPSTWIFATVKASWGPRVVAKIAFSAGNAGEYRTTLQRICALSEDGTRSMLHQAAKEQSVFNVRFVVNLSILIINKLHASSAHPGSEI
jgi:hypothetical protein